ncbi:MAG: hypothetical protein EXR67_00205 [Dehalococcoidia bacterium]|nr:hypothetical protein [Dehalococcoidia bacterium]
MLPTSLLFAGIPLVAFFGGAIGPTQIIVQVDFFGTRNLGAIRGLLQPAQATIMALSPMMTALLFDFQGSYTLAFTVIATMSMCGAIIRWLIRRPSLPTSKAAQLSAERS